MKIKSICFVLLATGAMAAFADPSVSITGVRAHYPWNGLVDIGYTIAGREGYDCDYQLKFSFGDTVARSFLDWAWCDLPVANGSYTVTWDSKADGVNAFLKGVTAKVELVQDVVTEADADYLIVDVSSGSSSSEYPVRYAKAPEGVTSAQFNKAIYKLDRIVLKRVKAGEFRMGDCNTETDTKNWHPVKLTKDYFLGVFEMTRKQYFNVMGAYELIWDKSKWIPAKCNNSVNSKVLDVEDPEKRPVGDLLFPVIEREETGVLAFLSSRAKCRGAVVTAFKLPTEAQWEHACRAGTVTKYWWGEDTRTAAEELKYEWTSFPPYPVDGNGGIDSSHEVGTLLPNPWGFYDMGGNIVELCRDWYAAYTGKVTDVNPQLDPEGPNTGTTKVARGGGYYWRSMYDSASGARVETKDLYNSSDYGGHLLASFGMRLCVTIPSAAE